MSQESNESPDDEYFEKALRMVGADRQKYPNSEELAKYEKMILYLKNIKFAEVLNRLEKIGEPYPGNKQIAQLAEMVQELSDAQVRQAESDIGSTKIILRKEQRERELEATVQELQNTIQQLQQGQPAPESIDQEYISLLESALNNALNGINPAVYKETQQIENPAERVDAFVKRYHELLGKIKQQIDKTKVLEKKSSDYAAELETAKAEKSRLEKEIEEKSQAIARLAAFEKESSKYAAELERINAEQARLEKELAAAKAKAFDPLKHITVEEHKHIISEKEQQFSGDVGAKCEEIAELQAANSELKSAEAGYIVEKDALSRELAKKDAELKTANLFLNQVQGTIDAANSEKEKAQRDLACFKGLEKLQGYHKSFMEQLKTQPVLVNLLLKAAIGMGKVRQDMSDPSKTQDLTENMDWLLLHIVDVLPRVYEWTEEEIKLVGEADVAKVALNKVIDAVKAYFPENEKKLFEQRIQESKQAEAAIQEAQGSDKNQLKKPEPINAIVSDMMRFANMQWHLDNETLVEAIFGSKKAQEYFAIKDPQKKENWVQNNLESFAEQCQKNAEAAAGKEVADALSAKADAESQRDASNNQLRELELSYKKQLIDLFALLSRDIEADDAQGVLAKMLVDAKGPKADTQDISIENLKHTIELALAQRADYKQRAEAADANAHNLHAALEALDTELKQKEEYVKDLEESKLNLGQTIGEQAKGLKEKEEKLQEKDKELARLNEKIQKLESGAGFTPTDYVLKTEHERILAEKDEEKRVLMKISEGHISKDEHLALVDDKADEVRREYLPVVLDQKKQISDLKSRISELEKTLADKENTPGVLAAAFSDLSTTEINDLRQQLEEAKRAAYNPEVHMPKAEHDAALAAKEAEVRNEYKSVAGRKEELEQKVREQQVALDGKSARIVRLERDLESIRSAKVEAEAILTGTVPYDPSKHVSKEDYGAQMRQKDEQLNAKQAEIAALTQAKSAVEGELAAARQNSYKPDVHMPKAEHDAALAAKEAEVRNEYKPVVDERDSLKQEKPRLEEKAKEQENVARQEKEKTDHLSAELAAIKAGALNPADYVLKSDSEKALADAKAASAEEKRSALEAKDAETNQRVIEKQSRIAELERIVGEKDAQFASAVLYDASKHVKKEEHDRIVGEQKFAYEAQIAGKQGEINGLVAAKSSLESELGQAKGRADTAEAEKARLGQELAAANANAYNPDRHMTKEDSQKALEAAQKAYSAETDKIQARIKELEVQVAAVQQKISEQKDESLQKLMNAAERMAVLLKENRELYAKLNPKL